MATLQAGWTPSGEDGPSPSTKPSGSCSMTRHAPKLEQEEALESIYSAFWPKTSNQNRQQYSSIGELGGRRMEYKMYENRRLLLFRVVAEACSAPPIFLLLLNSWILQPSAESTSMNHSTMYIHSSTQPSTSMLRNSQRELNSEDVCLGKEHADCLQIDCRLTPELQTAKWKKCARAQHFKTVPDLVEAHS